MLLPTDPDFVPAATVESLANDLDALVTLALVVRYGQPMRDSLGSAVTVDRARVYHLLKMPTKAIGQALADEMGTADAVAGLAFEVAERRPLSVSHRVNFLIDAFHGITLAGAGDAPAASE